MREFKTMVSAKTMGYISDFWIEGCNGYTDSKTEEKIENFISNWLLEHNEGFELPQWAIEQAHHNYENGQDAITALCETILKVAFLEWCDSLHYRIYDGMPGSDLVLHPVIVV
jgi:hypothetical protein